MRRVLITFWILVAVLVAAVGGLTTVIGAPPGAGTGAAFLFLSLAAVVSALLAARILAVVGRRRRPHGAAHSCSGAGTARGHGEPH